MLKILHLAGPSFQSPAFSPTALPFQKNLSWSKHLNDAWFSFKRRPLWLPRARVAINHPTLSKRRLLTLHRLLIRWLPWRRSRSWRPKGTVERTAELNGTWTRQLL